MEATIDPIYFVSEYTVVLKDNETGKFKLEKASVENFDRDFAELVKKYGINNSVSYILKCSQNLKIQRINSRTLNLS